MGIQIEKIIRKCYLRNEVTSRDQWWELTAEPLKWSAILHHLYIIPAVYFYVILWQRHDHSLVLSTYNRQQGFPFVISSCWVYKMFTRFFFFPFDTCELTTESYFYKYQYKAKYCWRHWINQQLKQNTNVINIFSSSKKLQLNASTSFK
jgi:hypothetical protein